MGGPGLESGDTGLGSHQCRNGRWYRKHSVPSGKCYGELKRLRNHHRYNDQQLNWLLRSRVGNSRGNRHKFSVRYSYGAQSFATRTCGICCFIVSPRIPCSRGRHVVLVWRNCYLMHLLRNSARYSAIFRGNLVVTEAGSAARHAAPSKIEAVKSRFPEYFHL